MPHIEYEIKSAGPGAFGGATLRIGSSNGFRMSCVARPAVPKIEHGRWTAMCRKIEPHDVSAPRLWTMQVRYDGEETDLQFYARAHPENKFPPSETVPSPVVLATFLEYCQVLAAKDAK